MDGRKKPVKVSPVIKGARWSFLFLGIFYGVRKKSLYREIEKIRKPHDEKIWEEKNIIKKEQLKKTENIFWRELAGYVNVEPPSW